jgi:hypothetical protein
MDISAQLDEAIRQRPVVPGRPEEGPYPATVDEVADEVVRWLRELDQTSARGVAYEVLRRLDGSFADPGGIEEEHLDALRHSHDPIVGS